ncbi:MAG: DUF748 domain-containing protein [Lentisphaerae bacterium]|nr:DUF748 domain-containing protein [Lentisphaerota bacterium]
MLKKTLKVAGAVVVVLLALVLALPAIVSTRGVRQALVKQVNARLAGGSLAVDDWSLGWWRGVRVQGVAYQDGEQRFGGTVRELSMSSGLWRLLAPGKNLGTIAIVEPHVWCDVSRLEGRPPPPKPESGKPRPKPAPPSGERMPLALDVAAKLKVQDARVDVRKPGQPTTTLIVDATVDCPSLRSSLAFDVQGRCRVGEADATARTAPDLTLAGTVNLLRDGVFDPAALVADVSLQTTQFDLGSLALARAFVPSLPVISGRLDSSLTLKADGTNALAVTGGTVVHGLQMNGGALGQDHLRLDSVRLDVDVTRTAGALTVKQLSVTSALATLKAAGDLTPVAGAPYPRGQITVIGNIHVADVAAQLPSTLHLQPDMRVTGGQLRFDGRVESDAHRLGVRATAGLSDVGGTQHGNAFHLAAPVALGVQAALTAQGPVLESFTLHSSFATATGSGSATGAVVHVEADLAAAAKDVGQFVDLGDLRAGGTLRATVQADLQAPSSKTFGIDLSLQGLSLAGLATRPGMKSVPDVEGSLQSRATVTLGEAGAITAKGNVQGTDIGLRGGALGADHPRLASLTLDLDVTRAGSQIVIRTLTLKSPLAQMDASGNVETVTGATLPRLNLQAGIDVNLAMLAAQIPHLLNVQPGVKITGGTFEADSKLGADGDTLTWNAGARIEQVAAMRGQQALTLSAPISLESRGSKVGPKVHVEVAKLSAGFAQLEAAGDPGQGHLSIQANLDRAMAELGQFVDFGQRQVGGDLVATVDMSSPTVSERQIKLEARVKKLLVAGMTPEPIRRDEVHLVKSGVIQFSPDWRITGLRALQVAVDGLPLDLKAQVALIEIPNAAAKTALRVGDAHVESSGTMEGLLAFCREAGWVKAKDLPLAGPVALDVKVSSTPERIQIQTFALTSSPLSMQAAGQLTDPAARRHLHLQGDLSSDCRQIALLADAFAGYRPDMDGKATRAFSLDTDLGAGDWQAILRHTEAKAGLHADRYASFGMLASNIDLALSVHGARAQVILDTAVNEGRVHAEPYLDLSGAQAVLTMPTNAQLLTDVRLNGDMASELLSRIHPIFYGCAVVGGQLSLTMDRLNAPLGPRLQQETTFAGEMRLHNLVLGSGQGLMGQLLGALHVSAQEVQVSNQVVRFECRDGRITPSPLTFKADRNKTIIVSGSVGLDQTLQYQAELPVTTNLLAELGLSHAAPYLKDTSVKVPIGGTVSSPRFDRQAFARAVKDMGAKAAKNAVIDQGGKLLGEFLKQRGGPAKEP